MGPTASGKTAFAIELAQRYGGEIVSVDSALVYRGLDIGAAKPGLAERAGVPHHLIDVREPWQPYSAAEFATDARTAIDGILARGRLPVLAGGTGLYFRALLRGLAAMPEADPAVRGAIAADAAARGWGALHAELGRVDPAAAARIRPGDAQRTHPACAGGVPAQRPADQRLGSATRRRRDCRCACSSWCWPRPDARPCTPASPAASTRCWPPASSTRCAACARCHRCTGTRRRWTCRRCVRSATAGF